jgi:hypothetical protein
LDECNEVTAREFINPVTELSSTRILVMSCNVPYIGRHFLSFPRLDVHASADDIRSNLDASIQKGIELADFVNEDLALYDKMLATIFQKSRGMYVDTLS